jgi:hypothetical protein
MSKDFCVPFGKSAMLLFLLAAMPQFALAAGSISGTVHSDWGYFLLEGVTVEAYNHDWEFVASAETDSSGTYVIAELPAGFYYLHTSNDLGCVDTYFNLSGTNGVPTRSRASSVLVTDDATAGAYFLLENQWGSQTISGRVTRDSDGAGISGILVIAYYLMDSDGSQYSDWAYTDDSGNYRITGLNPNTYFYLKTYNDLGFVDEYYNNVDSHPFATSVRAVSDADFSLAEGGAISGLVISDSDGAGIPNIRIEAKKYSLYYSGETSYPRSTRTDATGNYTVTGLATGNYFVRTVDADNHGRGNQYYDNSSSWGPTPVAVVQGAETGNVDFELPAAGSISGTVTRESDGSPAQLASIVAYDREWGAVAYGISGYDGTYSIRGLPPGSYYLRTNASDYVTDYYPDSTNRDTAKVVVVKASADTPIDVSLSSGGSISGRVFRSSDGVGLGWCTIQVNDKDWREVKRVGIIDFQGYYSVSGLPSGRYYVRVYAPPAYVDELYTDTIFRSAAASVEVTNGANTPDIDFSLDTGSAISGKVTRASDQAGIYRIPVTAYNSDWDPVKTVYTDVQGNYSLWGLPPGDYYLFTDKAQGYFDEYFDGVYTKNSATPVTVLPGADTINVDFELDACLSISGTVTQDFSGAPIPGIRINIYDSAWESVASGTTDETDAYAIEGLALGNYYVAAEDNPGFIDEYHYSAASKSSARQAILIQDPYVVNFSLAAVETPVTDFDGDLKSDISVWRESSGIWYSLIGGSPGDYEATRWGAPGDLPVPGDYDGDGQSDLAVWRPATGVWYILSSSAPGTYLGIQWGLPGDKPVPGDFDGDGKTDIAVWRPETGVWYVLPSSTPGAYLSTQWGMDTDVPIPGNYDGDNKTDIAVWRPEGGIWYVLPSESPGSYSATAWGLAGDKPVPGDFDGDGKTDVAVWRPSEGVWYVLGSKDPGTYVSTHWGMQSDVPASADYDGDATADIAVWRPETGTWYVLPSSTPGSYTATQWGMEPDLPLSSVSGILNSVP